jgi:hypothetical protein
MVRFRFWNNDSLLTQYCICSPTGGEPTEEWMRTQMAQRDMEPRSIDGERPPLSLGRKNGRDKKQQRGEQHNGRPGGDIPVRGEEYSPD